MESLLIQPTAIICSFYDNRFPEWGIAVLAAPMDIPLNFQRNSTLHFKKGRWLKDSEITSEESEKVLELNSRFDRHESTAVDYAQLSNDLETPDFVLVSNFDTLDIFSDTEKVLLKYAYEPCEYFFVLKILLQNTFFLDQDIYELTTDPDTGEPLVHILSHFFRSDDGIHKMDYTFCFVPLNKLHPADIETAEQEVKLYEMDSLTDGQANELFDKILNGPKYEYKTITPLPFEELSTYPKEKVLGILKDNPNAIYIRDCREMLKIS